MKFKTIHNEHDFKHRRNIDKHVLVRSGQTPKLRTIIEQASRGTAPTNIKFASVANDGFIPPQYSHEDITALHARYKSLSAEREALSKQKTVQPSKPIPQEVTPPQVPEQG